MHDIFNPHETKNGSGFGIKFISDNIAVMNSIESGSYPAYALNIYVIVQEKYIFWLNSKRLEINEYLIWKRKKKQKYIIESILILFSFLFYFQIRQTECV